LLIVFAVLGLKLITMGSSYGASVRLTVMPWPFEDVSLIDSTTPPASTIRDNMLLERNNFRLAALSAEVRARTLELLELGPTDGDYRVKVEAIPDSQFVDLVITARRPDLAEAIANTHAIESIRYYGLLRARPLTAMKDFVASQLQSLRPRLTSSGSVTIAQSPASTSDPNAVEAQDASVQYQFLLKKYAEATLAEANAMQPTNIQLVEHESATSRTSASRVVPLLALAFIGSLALGLTLILLLESLFQRTRAIPENVAESPKLLTLRTIFNRGAVDARAGAHRVEKEELLEPAALLGVLASIETARNSVASIHRLALDTTTSVTTSTAEAENEGVSGS
jgi:capsular polysaccharide biosynthesis protein